ncbi:MAG TPA: penicillin acylase family protein, partial [Anaerolineae bacterium]|nr:penicillin acylase family protein [Anaerolineae bacterium]
MRILRRIILSVLILVVLLGAVGAGGFVYLTRRAFPQIDGTIHLADLQSPVTIVRDKYGIPHIYASNVHDLFFAQGYVHAQDRLWQMDFNRRIGAGRLSELSASAVGRDKFIRTLGWRRAAQADLEVISEASKQILEAYADGVNAFVDSHKNSLPLEYFVLGIFAGQGLDFAPEPWTPLDTAQWVKVMSWNLSGNWEAELFRAAIADKFGPEAVADLLPAYEYQDEPVIVPPDTTGRPVPLDLIAQARELQALIGPRGRDIGSNNWVVAGSRTTTGKPLLANDPHLGFQLPSIWYFNSIHCQPVSAECPFDAVGASFPGAPGVIIGHNARIAWEVTNVGPDTQDLYLEKVEGSQVEFQSKLEPLKIVPETIQVRGKLPADYKPSPNETSAYDEQTNTTTITLNVRYTRHGPLISDVSESAARLGSAVAFQWTAINAPERTLDAFLMIDKAQNWDEFRAALSVYGTPSQNFVYADVDGNIGYQVPGRIPIRATGNGQFPAPGWSGEYEWTGAIPYDELPRSFNPSQGYIATANNAVVGPDYPYFITADWDRGYRARRIVEMIEARPRLSPDDMAAMQGDNLDVAAREIVAYLKDLTVEGDAKKALDAIRSWDLVAQRDSAGAGAYQVFWLFLLRNTFEDDLGDLAEDYIDGGDWNRQAVIGLLAKADARWWDDAATGATETRDDILKKSLADAAAALAKELGADPAGWAWGKLHQVTFGHPALSGSPVEFIFNRGPYPVSGGSALVNNVGASFGAAYDEDRPFSLLNVFSSQGGPSLRHIIDMGDLNASKTVNTVGQSGLPT